MKWWRVQIYHELSESWIDTAYQFLDRKRAEKVLLECQANSENKFRLVHK